MKPAILVRTVVPVLLFLGGFTAPARAQFIGNVSPQTNTKTYPAVDCSAGGVGTFNVPNIGQTVHFLSYFITGNPVAVNVSFQAVDPTSLAVYTISDVSTDPINGGILTANGSYARVQIKVGCSGTGLVTVTYYGSSSNSVDGTGLQDQTSYRKILDYKQSTTPGTTIINVQTPYGNTCGVLQFTYESAVAGSTISVTFPPEGPLSPAGTNFTALPATALPNSTTTQYINVPCYPTSKAVVTFQSGGPGGTFDLTYIFNKPGVNPANAVGSSVDIASVGGSPVSLGQKTMANSIPVAIASDQSAVPVVGNVGNGSAASGNPVTVAGWDAANVRRILTDSQGGIRPAGNIGNPFVDGSTNSPPYLNTDGGGITIFPAYNYAFNGSTWDRQFYCNKNVTIGPITTATTTQLIAGVASQKVRICSLIFANTAAATNNGTVKIVEGTGATCGTGTATLSATLFLGDSTLADSNVTWSFGNGAALTNATAANNICVTSTVTNTPSITVTAIYEQH